MADLNSIYNGVVEYFDPKGDSGIINPRTLNWFGYGGSNFWLEEMPYWPELDAINKQSSVTTNAVKVEYSGSTSVERIAWLKERIVAINERVKFIKGRTDQLLTKLQGISTDSYNTLVKLVTSALASVPVVGTAITFVQAQNTAAQTLQQYKLQALIQDYADDLKQLATIRNQLLAELARADPTYSTDPINQAPTVPTWYYYVGLGALLIIFVWLRRRNQKRRKR